MKQTPLLWEQFGDGSILLFWALTSRSEETMTVLWWVNSSTWCCFPLTPGIQHQQQSSCPQEALTFHLPTALPRTQPQPHPLFDVHLQQPTVIHLWHIKTAGLSLKARVWTDSLQVLKPRDPLPQVKGSSFGFLAVSHGKLKQRLHDLHWKILFVSF